MKNKIAVKLLGYFITSFVVFSIIIGFVFTIWFSNYTIKTNKNSLEKQAISIAKIVPNFVNVYDNEHTNNQNGLGFFIKNVNEIAMNDIWIIDNNLNVITKNHTIVKELPSDSNSLIKQALNGKTIMNESFSDLLKQKTISVATPIKDDSKVIGVLLLHAPLSSLDDAVNESILILSISMIIGIIVCALIAYYLALKFTKPLQKMKMVTQVVSTGNFDIQANIKQNDEIGQLASSLDLMINDLASIDKNKAILEKQRIDFYTNVSHEIRTPITIIRGSLEALNDQVVVDKDKVSEYYLQLLNETIYLERLVNDMLDLSKFENPDFTFDMDNVYIKALLDDVIKSMQKVAHKKNVQININKFSEQYYLNGDYTRLRQMLINIIDNAIKFSNDYSIIDIRIIKDKTLTIKIRDYGVGLNKEDLESIFNKFKTSKTNNNNGSGLGLSIVKKIADYHNIELVLNLKDVGLEFNLLISDIKG